ncbi:hypothetical protein [Promicromonospora sukumoe]|uniref:hypothetical protein n=1 Tax=Promicromonospora sukumoe TaxID=88382 RepID=UPI00364D1DCE
MSSESVPNPSQIPASRQVPSAMHLGTPVAGAVTDEDEVEDVGDLEVPEQVAPFGSAGGAITSRHPRVVRWPYYLLDMRS